MEMEIVGVDESIPEICCTRYFIAVQGYNFKHNHLRQDKKVPFLWEIIGSIQAEIV